MRRFKNILLGYDSPTAWLVLANVAVALALWTTLLLHRYGGLPDDWIFTVFALPAQPDEFLFRPWTLFTYMFAQANVLQLLFNMLWLVWFGRWLAVTDSPATLVGAYLGGGILGGMAYVLTGGLLPGSGTILMGSSAAVLSVMVYTTLRQPGRHVPLFLIGDVRLKWIAIFTVILTLLGATGLAAHIAHLGGILFPSILLAVKSRPHHARKPRQPKRKCPKALDPGRFGDLDIRNQPVPPEEVVDMLLDKIRVSGYESLTDREKLLLSSVSSISDN